MHPIFCIIRRLHQPHFLRTHTPSALALRIIRGLMILIICLWTLFLTPPHTNATSGHAAGASVTHEIRYRLPAAGEVFLVWGINGWTTLPEALRPAGTVVHDNVMYTAMAHSGDSFVARVQAPMGATLDYAFQITKTSDGAKIEVWDANGNPKQDYHTLAQQNGTTEIQGTVSLSPDAATNATGRYGPRWRWLLILLLIGSGLVFGIRTVSGRYSGSSSAYTAFFTSDPAKLVYFIIITRLILLFIGYISLASAAHPNDNYIGFDDAYGRQEIAAFGRADASWYMRIAQDGYEQRPFSLEKHANWAFYPLWPFILNVCNYLFADMLISGMLISTLFFVLADIFLYKLIALDFDASIAMSTAILAAIFPASYFFSRPGPEALFYFLTVAALFCARKNRWILAGLLGALATLSRLQGVLLFLPLLSIYAKQYVTTKRHNISAIWLMAIPAALVSFMIYLYVITGNIFASFEIQKIWDNNISYPFDAVIRFLISPQIVNYYGFDMSVLSFIFVFTAAILTIMMFRERRIPREYLIYTILNIFLIVARDTLTGSLRYMAVIFPLFLLIALLIENKKMASHYVFFAFITLQALYFISFVQQYNWAAN
jgi:hypothetical protein